MERAGQSLEPEYRFRTAEVGGQLRDQHRERLHETGATGGATEDVLRARACPMRGSDLFAGQFESLLQKAQGGESG